ncbi:ornithine carbamoyltransferase [Fructilactobacillus lindneri]|uniref:Ornithine carbamoyltransferase n=2 Tax=Fructilactobacillus lindneri TaxID=53444 RepID=A0A0R2JQ27_9LACO|nr:ornithine carbamoyltransferase [Fructilactobacillus lindneri]ANZ58393.1 ornithine carbamoyltransferase [Fructilactobacillus lindneri]ANZ59714.1 ornithine carbamoyltransferase [Fructilactobacillus lindneri]KRN79234.1 ornithine carbamoyltransferase [Fructilactobacillus lindneri DSM 20690 = JCM 11027]POG98503.1 ornithine carbamoyltransferase [Fructilactobacillus lindneri]POH03891.1 ornithine carbamoyltransferase [Fructilactobacillus lindneri]
MNTLKELKSMQGRSFLKEADFTPAQIKALIDFSIKLKAEKQQTGKVTKYLHDKDLILLFQKTSTRTRLSFELGGDDLGANTAYIDPTSSQFGKKESVADSARVFGELADGIEYRGFSQKNMEIMAEHAGVPVWNGLSNEWHPTQMIADFMTIKENFGHLKGLTLTFVGDGRNNMANSLLVTGSMLGVNVHIVAPNSLQPDSKIQKLAANFAKKSGAQLVITSNIETGVKNSNIIYTDVWVSMGKTNWQERIKLLSPYQVNMKMMQATGTPDEQLIFMHCLPAFHDGNISTAAEAVKKYNLKSPEMEVTDEVFKSKFGRQFSEAGNRKHSIMAIMAATLGDLTLYTEH